MADRVAGLLRFIGLLALIFGLLLAYYAITVSPPLYPPIETSYVIIGALMSVAGLIALISKYRSE
ncbi:MAG: hypothetical protein QXX17_04385 [Conexivisphaerales archaeon]